MKTMKNSILNLLIIALVSFTYTTNAQINFGNNYNQPTINTGANVNTGFKTLIPPLMWQIAICDGHRTSCNYDELRMIPTTNIVSVPRLFYLSVMGDGVPFQNVKVYAMGSGNTRYELPNYWVTAPYQHDVIEKAAWLIKFDYNQMHDLVLANTFPNLKLYVEGYVNGEFVTITQNFRIDG